MCVYACTHVRTLETRVGGDADRIDLNYVCVCVHVHTLETMIGGDGDRIDLNRVCVCVCARVCVHTLETRVGGDSDHIELNQETPTPTVCSPLPPSAAATSECSGTHLPRPSQHRRRDPPIASLCLLWRRGRDTSPMGPSFSLTG